MTKRQVKDVAASIRQRLYNNAKATGRPFQEVLQYFAMERFLYRLAQSEHAEKFVLKGALMFTAWHAPTTRPTKDIDLLARLSNRVDAILPVIREICLLEVESDGITFDAASLEGKAIREDADYEGVRVTFLAHLQNAVVRMQLDLGFGDVVTPPAVLTEYPTILDLSRPEILGYSRETVVAEKFEAMVKLGRLNSRMKDFFDIWLLSRQFAFEGTTLATAISRTLANRGTVSDWPPFALTDEFAADSAKITQWRGFLTKSRLDFPPTDLGEVIKSIASFLMPVAVAVQKGQTLDARWNPAGPWE